MLTAARWRLSQMGEIGQIQGAHYTVLMRVYHRAGIHTIAELRRRLEAPDHDFNEKLDLNDQRILRRALADHHPEPTKAA